MSKVKINITYEVDIPEGTSDDIIEETILAFIPPIDTIMDLDLLYDETYDIISSCEDPIVTIDGKNPVTITNSEYFYDKHRDEFNKKYF